LAATNAIFDAAPRISRDDYLDSLGMAGRQARLDYSFSLSPEEIAEGGLCREVAGCTGIVRLFGKIAAEKGLESFVVSAADYRDWLRVRRDGLYDGDGPGVINGHQIAAVEFSGGLRAFDPGKKLRFVKGPLRPGSFIESVPGGLPYLVCAITPAAEFARVDSYGKMRNVYLSGNPGAAEFLVRPDLPSVVEAQKAR
jgi:hypothetical protein